MKVNPIYSYEFNSVLNNELTDKEQLQNYVSITSDCDRFEFLIQYIEKNQKLIEKKLGWKLNPVINFFVVRCEKFKSFSTPITIEYSVIPEEMFLYLLKEILKVHCKIRFISEVDREQAVNSVITYLVLKGDYGNVNFIKQIKSLHIYSKEKFFDYSFEKSEAYNFEDNSLKEILEKMHE
jgi:hypothetical protein